MLGSEAEAERHMEATGHRIDLIPDETAQALEAHADATRLARIAGLMLLARWTSRSVDS